MDNYCGLDVCTNCSFKESHGCKGCIQTQGKPFGGECIIAKCCIGSGYDSCKNCDDNCKLKIKLLNEINKLNIKYMPKVTHLNALLGSYVNLEYKLQSGKVIKFWEDNKVYLGGQYEKIGTDRCYGVTADENYLLICEYGENGSDAKIIVYKKRGIEND